MGIKTLYLNEVKITIRLDWVEIGEIRVVALLFFADFLFCSLTYELTY